MNTNTSKKHKHHQISLSFPSCLFNCLCFTTILQVKGSGFKKDERHSCFFGLSRLWFPSVLNDTMQYPAEVDLNQELASTQKASIKETFTRLEREVTVPLAIQKVTLYAYTFNSTKQAWDRLEHMQLASLSFPFASNSHYMAEHIKLEISCICKSNALIVQYIINIWESFDICYGKVINGCTQNVLPQCKY